MDKSKTQDLVRRLGMELELAPLLDSDEAHGRFEKVVVNCLDSYKGKTPTIKSWRRSFTGRFIDPEHPGKSTDKHYSFAYKPIYEMIPTHCTITLDFDEVIGYFKKYYGIGCESKRMQNIDYLRTKSSISNYIDFIHKLLKQRHKQDIWYGTL
jgi:hypothetical protein